jgi:hypothetical protein
MHNWTEKMSVTVDHKQSEYDYLTGVPFYEDESNVPVQRYEVTIDLVGRDNINKFKRWLHSRKGRFAPFWMPLPDEGIILKETSLVGSYKLVSTNSNFAELIGGLQDNRRHIKIEMMNGTTLYNTLINASVLDDFTEELSLQYALAQEIVPTQVRAVVFLSLARLDADRIELAWMTQDYARVKMPVIEITNASTV